MGQFKIKVARMETAEGDRADTRVCITFQIGHGTVRFWVPIYLNVSHYDDTEMVQAARSTLHQTFAELAAQTSCWRLSLDGRHRSARVLRPQGFPSVLARRAAF